MIIATFGPTTGWSGKTIDYDKGLFTLEGHGSISAADVLAYDEQGQLTWAYDGLQAWVQQLAAGQGTAPVVTQPPASQSVAPQPGAQPPRRKGSALKVVLIVVGVLVGLLIVALVLGVALGGGSESSSGSTAESTPVATQPTTPAATKPATPAAATQSATPTPAATPTPTPKATTAPAPVTTPKASLAERVAADLHVRSDYTSFDIPKPKVTDEGPAYGGGKVVSITYYVPDDSIFNANAFVDGVSPATVDVMASAFKESDVRIVDVTWKTDFTDAYGKNARDAAFQIRWKRKTFKKADVNGLFDRVATSPEDLYRISDWYSIHPAIWQATHLKDQIDMIGGH